MRVFLLSCAAAAVIAIVAAGALNVVQKSSEHTYTTTGVRI